MAVNQASSGKKNKIIGVALLVIVAVLYWAIDIKWKDIETNTGYGPEARENPFLAAQKLLEQSGVDVESQRGFALIDQLPHEQDTIIITSARYSLGERRTELLKQWLVQGGNLIAVGKMLYNTDNQSSGDSLLDSYGIEVHGADLSGDEEQTEDETKLDEAEEAISEAQTIGELLAEKEDKNNYHCAEKPLFSALIFDINQPEINPYIRSPNILTYAGESELNFSATDGYGPQIMQLPVGKGTLTVLADMDLWRNDEIACFDNAYLLQILARQQSKTWLLYQEDMTGFMTLLWQKNTTVVISSLLLLFIRIGSQSLRFGVVKREDTNIRRNFIEHIEAAARYRWHSGEGDQIINLLRHQILQKLSQSYVGLNEWGQQQQVELIARLSDVTPIDIRSAMFDSIPAKPEQCINLVQRLQQLRKQLC
jgi:hypothetical protein